MVEKGIIGAIALIIITLFCAILVNAEDLPNLIPPSGIPSALSCVVCNSSSGNTTIIGGLPIWLNDSNNQIVINTSYGGDVNITGRNLILPSGSNTVVRTIDEGTQGILIDGQVADGAVINGIFLALGVPNGFGYQSGTYFFPQGIQASPQWWSYLANPTILGQNDADKFYGFYGALRSFSSIFPFTGTVNETSPFVSEPTWDGGTSKKLYGYIAKSVNLVSGTIGESGGIFIENQTNYSIYTNAGLVRFGDNVTAPYYLGNGTYLTDVCHNATQTGCGDGSAGNPFDQSLNTTDPVIFKNLTINSDFSSIPLLIKSGVNGSLTNKNVLRIIDNQSLDIMSLTSTGTYTITANSLGRAFVFDPVNGAIDIVGASLNFNRFTLRNMVVGGTGSGGVSASLLVGNGVGNTNFGSELAKLIVGTVGNNTRLIAAKGGLGQTRSAISVLNFSDTEVFNISTRGEVQASNITLREMLNLYAITLPTCAGASNGSIARNVTDNKPYWCDGTVWSALF